jgi:hypothetical protein
MQSRPAEILEQYDRLLVLHALTLPPMLIRILAQTNSRHVQNNPGS